MHLLKFKTIMSVFCLIITGSLYASKPLLTIMPLSNPMVSVYSNSSATVSYLVTNQSRKAHAFKMNNITGIMQNTTGANCSSIFTLAYQQSCVLSLVVSGAEVQKSFSGGPIICDINKQLLCYQPASADIIHVSIIPGSGSTTLSSSLDTLLLKQSGNARVISIVNSRGLPANNVTYSISPSLPAGTTISPASCGTISPGSNCDLTITPGATPTTVPVKPEGSPPVPNTLSVSGTNTNTVSVDISVLGFGNIINNGLIFYFDDTVPATSSVQGKVAGQLASEFLSLWTSTNNSVGSGTNTTDGKNNTDIIVSRTPCKSDVAQCAAWKCRAIGSDWYMPAVNEYLQIGSGLCANNSIPCDFGGFSSGGYFSSTQYAADFTQAEIKAAPFSSLTTSWVPKNSASRRVRCARAF